MALKWECILQCIARHSFAGNNFSFLVVYKIMDGNLLSMKCIKYIEEWSKNVLIVDDAPLLFPISTTLPIFTQLLDPKTCASFFSPCSALSQLIRSQLLLVLPLQQLPSLPGCSYLTQAFSTLIWTTAVGSQSHSLQSVLRPFSTVIFLKCTFEHDLKTFGSSSLPSRWVRTPWAAHKPSKVQPLSTSHCTSLDVCHLGFPFSSCLPGDTHHSFRALSQYHFSWSPPLPTVVLRKPWVFPPLCLQCIHSAVFYFLLYMSLPLTGP